MPVYLNVYLDALNVRMGDVLTDPKGDITEHGQLPVVTTIQIPDKQQVWVKAAQPEEARTEPTLICTWSMWDRVAVEIEVPDRFSNGPPYGNGWSLADLYSTHYQYARAGDSSPEPDLGDPAVSEARAEGFKAGKAARDASPDLAAAHEMWKAEAPQVIAWIGDTQVSGPTPQV